MLKLSRLEVTRVVAKTAALESIVAELDGDTIVLRQAPDEFLFLPALPDSSVVLEEDPYAIILEDSSWFGGWLAADETAELLERHCEWEPPAARPAYTQGAVAEIPTMMHMTEEKTLFVVHAPYVHDFEERIS